MTTTVISSSGVTRKDPTMSFNSSQKNYIDLTLQILKVVWEGSHFKGWHCKFKYLALQHPQKSWFQIHCNLALREYSMQLWRFKSLIRLHMHGNKYCFLHSEHHTINSGHITLLHSTFNLLQISAKPNNRSYHILALNQSLATYIRNFHANDVALILHQRKFRV